MFDKNLKKQFANTYKFSKHGISEFILLLQKKSVYPYEYMDYCVKFNQTSSSEKEDF